MYDVTIANGNVQRIIHDHRGASNAQKLPSGSIVDAVNSISSFSFEIYPENAGFDQLNARTTQVRVRNTKRSRNDFVGRVLQVNPSMNSRGMFVKQVVCEDRLGFLHDSVQPFSEMRHYEGDESRTGLEEFIDILLGNHNTQVEPYKRIYRGTVTVKPFASSNDVTKELNWQTTYEAIQEKLLKSFGGFIVLRETAGVLYLDYLGNVGTTRSTKIKVGRNMRSISKEIDPSGIITRLIPLGKKLTVIGEDGNEVETEERLTIASVNDGLDYIVAEEYEKQFGIRYGTVIFDDVTDPHNLMRKGIEYQTANNGLSTSHNVYALDLSQIGLDIDDFVLYDRYPVENEGIGVDDILQIVKKTTNIIEPHNSSFEMGTIMKKLSDMIIDEMLNIGVTNGKNSYLHVRYSEQSDGSNMTIQPTSTTKYVGIHSSLSAEAPTDPEVYKWTLMRGSDGKDGANGAAGKDGKDGKDGISYYTWIKYADSPTSGMSDNPEGKKYIGIAYNKTALSESASYGDYTWSLIKGEDGSDGVNGVDGEDGKTYFTWIKYADDANGANMSNDSDGKFYIGIAYNKETSTESNVASDYTWSLFRGYNGIDGKDGAQGPQGIQGPSGKDGQTLYTWLKYADTPTSGMSDTPDGKKYIGLAYNKTTPTESGNYADYTWSLIKGEDGKDGADGKDGVNGAQGPQGVPGPAGADGKTLYTWIRYADDASGNGMSQYPDGKLYIGLAYNKETATESNKASDYAWSLIKGVDGKDGANGTNGKDGADGVGVERITPRYAVGNSSTAAPSTPTIAGWSIAAPELAYGEYLWCSYYVQYTDGSSAWTEPFHARSADQITQAESEPEKPTAGTLWLDTSETPYTLKRFNGTAWVMLADYSNDFEEVYTYVNTTVTDLVKTTEGLVASVAEETVSKNVYEEFTTLVKNILKMEADGTTMIFQTINEAIHDIGDTEASHYAELLTYIRFSDDGIEIGKQGNAITMRLDNDSLDFYNNGTRVAYMSDNTLYITDGRFTRSVRIGNYGFIPEANGSVSFTYLGGDS